MATPRALVDLLQESVPSVSARNAILAWIEPLFKKQRMIVEHFRKASRQKIDEYGRTVDEEVPRDVLERASFECATRVVDDITQSKYYQEWHAGASKLREGSVGTSEKGSRERTAFVKSENNDEPVCSKQGSQAQIPVVKREKRDSSTQSSSGNGANQHSQLEHRSPSLTSASSAMITDSIADSETSPKLVLRPKTSAEGSLKRKHDDTIQDDEQSLVPLNHEDAGFDDEPRASPAKRARSTPTQDRDFMLAQGNIRNELVVAQEQVKLAEDERDNAVQVMSSFPEDSQPWILAKQRQVYWEKQLSKETERLYRGYAMASTSDVVAVERANNKAKHGDKQEGTVRKHADKKKGIARPVKKGSANTATIKNGRLLTRRCQIVVDLTGDD